MLFFDNVKKLCKEKGLTIESVANKAGLTIDSYNSYRRHKNLPRADEATKIAEVFGTTVERLVTGEDRTGLTQQEEIFLAKLRSLSKENQNAVYTLLNALYNQEELLAKKKLS